MLLQLFVTISHDRSWERGLWRFSVCVWCNLISQSVLVLAQFKRGQVGLDLALQSICCTVFFWGCRYCQSLGVGVYQKTWQTVTVTLSCFIQELQLCISSVRIMKLSYWAKIVNCEPKHVYLCRHTHYLMMIERGDLGGIGCVTAAGLLTPALQTLNYLCFY